MVSGLCFKIIRWWVRKERLQLRMVVLHFCMFGIS